MIDKYLLQELGRRNDEKGELARWVIQLEADVDTERRKTAARDSVIYARDTRIAELEADVKVWESAALKYREAQSVAWLAIYHGEVYDEAIGITRSVVEAHADRFGWESALTEIIPLYRHTPPAPAVPDGFKLVPTVPTPEMIAAAMNCDDVTFINLEDFCVNFGNIYAAMLAAAPEEK
ncbi:hypothetical protein JY459_15430 [Serratia marcescens]|nr:hypothetical protein [Serratia marcescens]